MKAEETVDFFLKSAWQSVANTYNQVASKYGISQTVGYMLIHIHEEGTTVSQLASFLCVKPTSLSRILANMEKHSLVYRQTDSSDKRSVKIFLTDAGKEKRQVAKKVVRKFNEYLNDNICEEERIQLINGLKKINQLTLAYKPEQ
jgi:DNA-binding MarR family transcriptional regulator